MEFIASHSPLTATPLHHPASDDVGLGLCIDASELRGVLYLKRLVPRWCKSWISLFPQSHSPHSSDQLFIRWATCLTIHTPLLLGFQLVWPTAGTCLSFLPLSLPFNSEFLAASAPPPLPSPFWLVAIPVPLLSAIGVIMTFYSGQILNVQNFRSFF